VSRSLQYFFLCCPLTGGARSSIRPFISGCFITLVRSLSLDKLSLLTAVLNHATTTSLTSSGSTVVVSCHGTQRASQTWRRDRFISSK